MDAVSRSTTTNSLPTNTSAVTSSRSSFHLAIISFLLKLRMVFETILKDCAVFCAVGLLIAWVSYFVGVIDRPLLFMCNGLFIGMIVVSGVVKRRVVTREMEQLRISGGRRLFANRGPQDIESGNSEYQLNRVLVDNILVREFSGMAAWESSSCVICLVDFNENETVSVLGECGHMFHSDCLLEWFRTRPCSTNLTCPTCRGSLSHDWKHS